MDHLKKLPGEVSGGMKKRAGLARAMVTEPEIVLFDEPDSGLDPVRVAYLDELVVTAQKETGATFFIITHNISSVMRTAEYMGVLLECWEQMDPDRRGLTAAEAVQLYKQPPEPRPAWHADPDRPVRAQRLAVAAAIGLGGEGKVDATRARRGAEPYTRPS